MDKLLLYPAEVAELLSISKSKLYGLLARGELESVQVGRCRRVPAKALHRYLDRLERDAA